MTDSNDGVLSIETIGEDESRQGRGEEKACEDQRDSRGGRKRIANSHRRRSRKLADLPRSG